MKAMWTHSVTLRRARWCPGKVEGWPCWWGLKLRLRAKGRLERLLTDSAEKQDWWSLNNYSPSFLAFLVLSSAKSTPDSQPHNSNYDYAFVAKLVMWLFVRHIAFDPHLNRAVVTSNFKEFPETSQSTNTITIHSRWSAHSSPTVPCSPTISSFRRCPLFAQHGDQSPNRHQARKFTICAIQTRLAWYALSTACPRWIYS